MDSWPLPAQWAVLVVLAWAVAAGSWRQALVRARADGAEPATWSGRLRMVVKDLGLTDWAFVALFAAFFVPLLVRTLTGA